MNRIFPGLILSFLLLNYSFGLRAQNEKPSLKYTDGKELTLIGKIADGPHHYHRVDTSAYKITNAYIQRLLSNPAGMALVFKTNSTSIQVKWCVADFKPSPTLTPAANKGLDLYIKKQGAWQYAGTAKPDSSCSVGMIAANMDSSEKECLLYLPLYEELKSIQVGVDQQATINSADYPVRNKVLVYGSSITQGAAASRPGLAYPAILERKSGISFLNLGLSGSAKMENYMADLIATIDADAYILDCVPNSSPQIIKERTAYLVKTIRDKHPGKPIIVINTIFREQGHFNRKVYETVTGQIRNMKEQVDSLKKEGIKDLYYIDVKHVLGEDHEGTSDGVHPNDLGFHRMTLLLQKELKPIFRKYGIRYNPD